MKKVVFILILALGFLQYGVAQTQEDWQQQMDNFQRRMQEMTEQLSQQFGGKSFNFDTAFIMPFDGHSFDSTFVKHFNFDNFNIENFPFDTSMIKGFRWYGSSDEPMQIDTMYFKQFKNFDSDELPDFQFDSEWSKGLSEMMQQLMKQFEGMGEEFNKDGSHYYYKEWKSDPKENKEEKREPAPKPAPQKKRKTTIM